MPEPEIDPRTRHALTIGEFYDGAKPPHPGLDLSAYDAFRAWLAHVMRERGVSQSELARRAGTAQCNISEVLAGLRPGTSIDYADRLSAALGMKVEQVIRRGRRL